MKWYYLARLALRSILRNRMRSLLTMLGIVIGVGAVIALLSVGRGTQAAIESDISSLGTNLIMVRAGSASTRGVSMGASSMNTLSMADVAALGKLDTLAAVSPFITVSQQVVAGSKNWLTTVSGVDPGYLSIRNLSLQSGRFLVQREVDTKAKVAIMGQTVAEELFGSRDPLGARIRVGSVPFTVIGLLSVKGDAMGGMDQDDLILAPSSTVLFRLGDGETVRTIVASATSDDVMSEAQEQMTALLRTKHGLGPSEENDFTIRSQTEITETASSITGTLIMLLSAIAAVSLVVGGIGIMNIMLVSVTERTREIGIRLAVGARARDVLAQFLVESVILCLIGGIGGILAGLGTGQLLGNLMGVDAVVEARIVLVAFAFSGAVGVFFGFYPARKASRMDPIQALRHE